MTCCDRSRAPNRRWAPHTGRGSVLIEAGGFYPKFYGTWEHASLETEIIRRTCIARNCMALLKKHVKYPGRYNGPVVSNLCPPGVGVWFRSVDNHKGSCSATGCLWSVRKILRIPYSRHVTNASVKETTGCPPVFSIIKTRRLRFFGHVARSYSRQENHRAINASLRQPRDWRRPRGRPRTSWLRGIDANVQSANIDIHSAWRKTNDRVLWRRVIDTATLH